VPDVGARIQRAEPGSFRDRDSRVFVTPEGVFRALSARGLEDFEALRTSALFEQALADGTLVPTELADLAPPEGLLPGSGAAAVLRHERLPFISYPYEWTFGMLRDAALLHLDLLDRALAEELTLKDASPYNVQWRGVQPVFADIGSFEPLRRHEPWIGYRQFCMLFLFPLMLQAYRGVPFHPWLRGSLEGIAPTEMASLLRPRDRLRKGVLMHVALHARLERKHQDTSVKEVKQELKSAGFKPEIVRANVRRMHKLVSGLRWKTKETAWTGYHADNRGYEAEDRRAKEQFVAAAAERVKPRLAWDLGTNDGAFARVVAPHAEHVVAMDFDHETVEHLYRALRAEGETKILPLVSDLTDPSPARGWRGAERQTLEQRGRPDLTLSLALVHHISITRHVPIAEVVDWLASLGGTHVVEFPKRDDAMVVRLLAAKREGGHEDYDLEHFERCLAERFEIRNRLELRSRVLFDAAVREA
jgi:ribosomal protein L11 methylase PrmA